MSGLLVDIEEELNMPGGVGFIDATDILERGTKDMAFGTILSMDGFELSDAMSALEIMDPRMDTGMTAPPPPFYPNMPMLPSEVCWILDRSFACEMSWHTGLALSQTVYTLRYVHHLGDIANPRFKVDATTQPAGSPHQPEDPERPLELVTLVLRAGVFGLLKCCDLVWREVADDHLFDGEDWNSEKYGVSLCEGVQPESLLSLLDEAVIWLQQSPTLSSSSWREPLIQRLLLRRNIFQTLAYPSFPVLHDAQGNLRAILAGPSPTEPSVAVSSVFDPAIARRLVSFIPTRVVELPHQPEVWEAIATWLDQWLEVRQLIGAENLWCVKILAGLRAYEGQSPRRSAFLRSLSISTFFNGSKILLTHDPPWLIDRFFLETAAISPGLLSRLAEAVSEDDSESSSSSSSADHRENWKRDPGRAPSNSYPDDADKKVELFEKGLAKQLVDYFTSFYHNRARQRRKLVDSILDWHLAFEHASDLVMRLSPISSPITALSRVPLCIRHIRLSIITEVVLSGFELELYARHEWAMMYWYAGEILNSQVALLDEFKASLSREDDGEDARQALTYASIQWDYAHALRCFAMAMRDVLYRYPPSRVQIDRSREQANFEKRFKWAFITGYSEATTLDEDRPILGKWRRWQNERQPYDDEMSQSVDNLIHARKGFSSLSKCKPTDTAAVFCEEAYRDFMLGLTRACDATLLFLQKPPEVRDAFVAEWVWESSSWFPQVGSSPVYQ